MSITAQPTADDQLHGCRVVLRGPVQGLGVRPVVYRLAKRLGLSGVVRNCLRGVEVDVEGTANRVTQFVDELASEIRRATGVDASVEAEHLTAKGYGEFSIEASSGSRDLSTPVPNDLCTCQDCLADCDNSEDRRYFYPLVSCAQCGPRYTIIQRMPYERADTTMRRFELCPSCRAEYESPADRRFHAQTTACPRCGPDVWCADGSGRVLARANDAIELVVRELSRGKIIALRGIGGYQLLVDATNEEAVRQLRKRKRRTKPLAVMVKSLLTANTLAFMSDEERGALSDVSNPIVLLRAKSPSTLARDMIHPGLNTLGLMLPTTALHALVARGVGRPLVCTSGNLESAPIEFEVDAARSSLNGICDVWLHHDRPIARPIDDSVVRVIAGRQVTIRLGRGLGPLPLDLPSKTSALALGGYLKSAAAWSNGSQSVLGPHVGDHETVTSRQRFLVQCDDWQRLYQFQPECLAHDMHPEYFTTSWARQQSLRTYAVQHHHAHIVAGMLEHGWLDREVLGVAWDGTGLGADGSIWGGEFLVATATSFRREASMRPFGLPGGEAAIREPWRIAVGLARSLTEIAKLPGFREFSPTQLDTVRKIGRSATLSTKTTSVGRLFDAAAAIILGVTHAQFDGQAAMQLETVADRSARGEYEFPLRGGQVREFDWRPMVAGLVEDRVRQKDPAAMAMKFHRTMATAAVRLCRRFPSLPIVLGGGVFQNQLLTELIADMLAEDSRQLGLPGTIPPNDGGLAAGQLAVAAAQRE